MPTPEELHTRNKRVEADKAWETSLTRRACIVLITYLVACAILWFIGAKQPYLGACVPVAGFILSTLSLGTVKHLWLTKIYTPKD